MHSLLKDVRYALRMMLKSPGFSGVAILTLALGIGANTAIFSLVDAALLRLLPVKDPGQLVLFTWNSHKEWPPNMSQTGAESRFSFSFPAFKEFRDNNQVLSSAFAFVPLGFTPQNATIALNGRATLANAMMVTGQFFSGLGVTPLLGRAITPADETPGAPRVAVISYSYWSRRFGNDPSVIGRSVALNGAPFTIVGVLPPAFTGVVPGDQPDVWLAFDDQPDLRPWGMKPSGSDSVYTARNWLCLNIMGRLKPGVTRAQAAAQLGVLYRDFLTQDWKPQSPDTVPGFSLTSAAQGVPYVRQQLADPLLILMCAVSMVLLVACANIATLLLARAMARQKEVSVRLALGVPPTRLVRQLLTESVVLSTLGGLLGLVFADQGIHWLLALFSTNGAGFRLQVTPDVSVLFFTLGASVLTGILFGLAPALRAARLDLAAAMRETAANVTAARDKHRLGRALVVGQVAVALVLLIGAGLFVRTLVNYEQKDFGFDQSHLLVFGVDPTRNGYHGDRLVSLYSQLLDRVQALPGVRSATLMEFAPFSGWSNNTDVRVFGLPAPTTGAMLRYQVVGPDFFRTMRIPILLGRPIERSDTAGAPQVAVVDETFVKKFLGHTNPIGQRIYFGNQPPASPGGQTFEIIGVAKPAELTGIDSTSRPHAYFAYAQFPKMLGPMFFQVRASGDPLALVSGLRDQVARMDPNLPLIGLETDRGTLIDALAQQRLFAHLSSIFGLLALVLATIGLYGTMAYTVSRKTHEIGIRMALGARPGEVVRMFVGQGIRLAAFGVAIGLAASLYLTRLTHKLIFGISPNDPLTFIAAAAFFVLVCAAACYVPARRATRVAPVRALHYE